MNQLCSIKNLNINVMEKDKMYTYEVDINLGDLHNQSNIINKILNTEFKQQLTLEQIAETYKLGIITKKELKKQLKKAFKNVFNTIINYEY